MRGLVIAGSLLLVSGCAPSNLADAIRAGGENTATVCARVTTIYGTLTFMRSNVATGDVSCDTLTIKSTTNVSIPMTVTPSFNVTPTAPLPVAPPLTVPRPVPPPPPVRPNLWDPAERDYEWLRMIHNP